MMTFHYAPGTISAVSTIALYVICCGFDSKLVNFQRFEQKSPAYLSIDPKGRVPTLVIAHGTITETSAILDYIAAMFSEAGLVPKDPFEAAQMRSVMTYLASTMHVNHAYKMRGPRCADRTESWDDMRAKVSETMADSATFVETHALEWPFVLGERISLADPYLYVVGTWLEGDGVSVADFPKFATFQAMMATGHRCAGPGKTGF